MNAALMNGGLLHRIFIVMTAKQSIDDDEKEIRLYEYTLLPLWLAQVDGNQRKHI